MKSQKIAFIFLLGICVSSGSANVRSTVCETDDLGVQARLEFEPTGPGRAKASVMEYQGQSVLKDPDSIFNHMGVFYFRGENSIEFHAYEYSDDFHVMVPAFGGQLVVSAQGKCALDADVDAVAE